MKRCIICGNVDDDNSTVCSVCGNPYVKMGETVSDTEEARAGQPGPDEATTASEQGITAGQPGSDEAATASEQGITAGQPGSKAPQDAAAGQPGPEAPQGIAAGQSDAGQSRSGNPGMPGQPSSGNRPQRRVRGGPQIYGQTEGMNGNPEMYANQGMVRRTLPPGSGQSAEGRPSGRPAGGAGRSSGPMPGGAGTGRPSGRRPGNPAQGGAGRPSGQDFLEGRVRETARKSLKSPLFFLIVILNTVFVVSSIAAIILNELNYSQIVRLMKEADLPQQASGYVSSVTTLLQQLDSGIILPNVLLHIPQILFCLGLWLILITAFAAKDRMSGVGFGFAKAAVIIRMVAACIIMLASLLITVTVVVAAWASGQRPVIIMSVVILVITIIIVMMIIMYYFGYLATLKACRVNSNTGESYGKLSAYVAVLHVLLGLTGIVGLLSGIVNMEISGIIGSAAKIGWMILFAVWIFRYRGKMSEFED